MKIYLVGGAVRDKLLGRPIKEKDWVVVGSTVPDMLAQGFRQVGKDFPVFLHPKTKEEYALARTERKVGAGYTGFKFDVASHITLEEDLKRRDLTINAIAEASDGTLIDPYHGQDDLSHKLLRHVSDAFVEDPVRILRVGRFMARLSGLGFKVAPETMALMKKMVDAGEVNALVSERVWKELERTLAEEYPAQFFKILAECHALSILFPSLRLDSAGMAALQRATKCTQDPKVRFAALLHDCSEEELEFLGQRYSIPNDYRELALLTQKNLEVYQKIPLSSAEDLVQFLQKTDAFRREKRFCQFLICAEVCTEVNFSPLLLACLNTAKAVNVKPLLKNFKGKEIALKLLEERIKSVSEELKNWL